MSALRIEEGLSLKTLRMFQGVTDDNEPLMIGNLFDEAELKRLQEAGFVVLTHDNLRLTTSGRLMLDSILPRLLA